MNPLLDCKKDHEESCTDNDLDKLGQLEGAPLGGGQIKPSRGNPAVWHSAHQVRVVLRGSDASPEQAVGEDPSSGIHPDFPVVGAPDLLVCVLDAEVDVEPARSLK